MKPENTPETLLEPERYELYAEPLHVFDFDRREFSKLLGAGLVVLLLKDTALAQESGGGRAGSRGRQRPAEISAWLHIGEDGTIKVFTGKAEVGQNIRTSLNQAVAEELRVPIASVQMVMADTDLTPYDAGTFGSRTTPDMSLQLHKVSAAAREVLLDMAADEFKTDRSMLTMAEGRVLCRNTQQSITLGQLTQGRQLLKSVTASASETAPERWTISGTSVPKIDGRSFVTGAHKYTPDLTRPGLQHGKVLRPEAFGAELKSVDLSRAKAMPNVTVVRNGNFVGVTAPDAEMAARAIEAIKAQWTTIRPQLSSSELFDHLKKHSGEATGRGRNSRYSLGSMEEGLKSAHHKLQQRYTIAYIAHAPLEPRAALAEWRGDKLTVWTGTQRPFGIRGELAQAFGLPEERIRVIVPDTGSGYGGKHTGEAAVEAARLAKAAGKPVKVVWTREEEFTWAYCRPAGVIEVLSGVRDDGTVSAWEFHNINSGSSAIRTPYDIPNQTIEFHPSDSPLRQGSYRALASTANVFARESHMDELAEAVRMDPLQFRLKNLKDNRLRAVLQAAAEAFGWGQHRTADGRGFGIAGGTEKGSYVATCAEVRADRSTGSLKVVRVTAAFECGPIVNPDHLKNQIEGSIVMGLGGALFEAIRFENGKILNPHFASYRVPRFSDTPRIEVVLVNRKDLPLTGAGETPIIGIAPAVGNALFAATGVRLRSLPMVPRGLATAAKTA